MADNFVSYDRDTLFLLPPSVQDWLPEKHLARFVVDVVAQLDLRQMRDSYAGCGSAAYHPEMLVALLFFAYATGMRASRKIEAATYDSVALRYIAANTHPDHDTIAAFRRRFLPHLNAIFNQILLLAKDMKCLAVGKVSLDGTKIKASASKHRALSLKGANQLETRLKREVARMLELAEKADRADEAGEGEVDLPAEIQMKSRKPERPKKGVRAEAQLNLTDSESRIMPSSEGFIQGYNAQAAVDTDSMLIVAADLSQRPTDRRLLKPMLKRLGETGAGQPDALIADAGYFSELNVELCVAAGITPYIVPKRDRHHWGLRRLKKPKAPGPRASALETMLYRLRTPDGRAIYALRKCTVEPVFGILKRALGFRQFLLRGYEKAQGEYQLGCVAWNIKRLHALVIT